MAFRCISARPRNLNREHLKRLKALVKRTKTPWLSDHLCWGSVDGRYTHDLLPMPYTFEAAQDHGAEDPRGAGLSGSADRGGKRQQLRGVSRFRNDRVGIPERSGRAGRLRHPARREQHLRLVAEPRFRSLRICEQRSAPSASRRFTSPGIPNTENTSSTRTIIR